METPCKTGSKSTSVVRAAQDGIYNNKENFDGIVAGNVCVKKHLRKG